jgi:hypothetical protein
LLHRISNDQDQELVKRLVPDNLRGLLRELPSLPSQHAILMGWASELPVLLKMNDLSVPQQPHSDDPDFWDVWTRRDTLGKQVERRGDWNLIASDWQGRTEENLLVDRLRGMSVETREQRIAELLECYVESLALGDSDEISRAMAETNSFDFEILEWEIEEVVFKDDECLVEVLFCLVGTQHEDRIITSNRIRGKMTAAIANDGIVELREISAGVDCSGWDPDDDAPLPC